MSTPRNILVPTDFSHAARAAKTYAGVLAEAFGSKLHLLHVIPDPLSLGWGIDAAELPQLLERTERAVRDELDAALTARERATSRVTLAVEVGQPVDAIVRYADAHTIDLIVMGSQGRGAVERMWVGSVAQGVLRRATCPVLMVH